MASLLQNFKVWAVLVLLVVSLGIVLFAGLNFGIDFKGGTVFQIHLEEKLSQQEIERVAQIFEQRLNWTGLKDLRVFTLSNEFVVIQLAETDPDEVQKIESLLKKQGKFEVKFEGKTLFTGSDIIGVDSSGVGVASFGDAGGGYTSWNLPFTLKSSSAKTFRDAIFHKCTLLGVGTASSDNQFDCPVTYFFIDRPADSIIISTSDLELQDSELFKLGNVLAGIPQNTDFDELRFNADISYLLVESNNGLSASESSELSELFSSGKKKVIIPSYFSDSFRSQLTDLGFRITGIERQEGVPYFWTASNSRQVVRLQASITGNNPYVEIPDQQKIITDLIITGTEQSAELAQEARSETKAILQTGSLPVSVESISRETISPLLGSDFLNYSGLIAVLVLLAVAAVIFIRYRNFRLSAAIVFTSLTEAFGALAFTSLVGNIDLAAIAGIIAAVGTGVDDQIIITDELSIKESEVDLSLLTRVKRAFFIIFAAAATTIAVMLPVLIFGFAMIKILGFAIATIIGVLVGVFITRPFYAELAKKLI